MSLLGAKAKPAADDGVRFARKPGTNQVGELALEPLQTSLECVFSFLLQQSRAAIVVAAVDEGLAIGQRQRMLLRLRSMIALRAI